MKLLDSLRRGLPGSRAGADAPDEPAPAPDDGSLPIAGYERLSAKEVTGRLHLLTQVELATIEAHERAHRARAVVLTKLGYMREDEPLPGYDALSPAQVVEILTGADAETVRTIRDYERKFQHRREISEAVARLLPKARPSDREDRVAEERTARISAGHRSRTAAGEKLQNARDDAGAESVQP